MTLNPTTDPSCDPVTAAEAFRHSRIDDPSSDQTAEMNEVLIPAAREYAEAYTGRQLIPRTWALVLDRFPRAGIYIPKPPLVSVSSVAYVDSDGVSQALATSVYETAAPSGPQAMHGRLRPAYGQVWPSTYSQMEAVTITFVAGYAALVDTDADKRAAVPSAIRRAILVLVAEMNERREQVIVGTISTPATLAAERLLGPFRVF